MSASIQTNVEQKKEEDQTQNSDVECGRRQLIDDLALLIVRQHRRGVASTPAEKANGR